MRTLPDCSVCRANYTATLPFRCSECSTGNVAVVVVVIAIAILTALAFLWHMVSNEKEGTTRGVTFRVEKVLPLQSIKIIVVAWQIISQVSTCAMVNSIPESTVTCLALYIKYSPVSHWRK